MTSVPEKLVERTMESDSADAIKYCIEKKFTKLVVRFNNKTGGWRVDHAYCCKEHTPKLILNSERSES